MAVYLVTYDLNKQKNYPKLYDGIKSAGSEWAHVLDSTWFIVSRSTAAEIRDHLRQYIDGDDSILVVHVKTPTAAAWRNLREGTSDWLKNKLEQLS